MSGTINSKAMSIVMFLRLRSKLKKTFLETPRSGLLVSLIYNVGDAADNLYDRDFILMSQYTHDIHDRSPTSSHHLSYTILPMNHLIMTNQPSLRSIIRIRICPRKSQCSIPSISGRHILRSQRGDLCLRSRTRCLSRRIGVTDISQLVTNSVCDNIRVQRLFLALVDKWINGLECEFSGRSSV